MSWQTDSEIICGYVLKDKLPADAVNPLDVYPAYVHIIKMKREGAELPDIVSKDFGAVDACLHAVERVNGTLKAPIDYLRILQESATLAKGAVDLDTLKKRMERGEKVSPAEILAVANKLDTGYDRFIPMSDVEPQKVKFDKTGYAPIDKYIGGIPHACVTIIGGSPGIGKTSFALKVVLDMIGLKENKKKKAAILSLEMTMGQIHQRFIEMSQITKEEKERILLGRLFNIHEITAAVTQLCSVEKVAVVMIDFADLIVEGEQTESAMGLIYKNLELLATKTEVPIILICQLNRQTYAGGLPKIHHIRWSSMAEATARLILLAYNPNSIVANMADKDNQILPPQEGRGYVIVGKSNFGFKEGKPGAIVLDWDGEAGWGDKPLGYIPLSVAV